MRQVKKRLFAAALSLAMFFSLFPEASFATASVTETAIESAQNADALSADTQEMSDETQSVAEDGGTPDEAQSATDEVAPEDGETSDEAQSATNNALPIALLQSDAVYQDGTYTGSGQGFGGAVTVK